MFPEPNRCYEPFSVYKTKDIGRRVLGKCCYSRFLASHIFGYDPKEQRSRKLPGLLSIRYRAVPIASATRRHVDFACPPLRLRLFFSYHRQPSISLIFGVWGKK